MGATSARWNAFEDRHNSQIGELADRGPLLLAQQPNLHHQVLSVSQVARSLASVIFGGLNR